MDDLPIIPNPNNGSEPPFAGRREIYARLHHQIFDPPERRASLFLGHGGIGKSAFLWHFSRLADDAILTVYFPLDIAHFEDETQWLQYIIQRTNQMLDERQFSLSRVPQRARQESTDEDSAPPLHEWFRDVYLPEVLHIIRPQRRLVWLFDDAEYLLDAMPRRHPGYLSDLLMQHSQIAILMTMHMAHEDRVEEFGSLVNPTHVERLSYLTEAETSDVIRQFVMNASEALQRRSFALTGGHPSILQSFGEALLANANLNQQAAYTAAQKVIYHEYQDQFHVMWRGLKQDERLVLTAISGLLYDNPLQHIQTTSIEKWLVETDYPLDIIAINAAVRGLVYHDIAINQEGAIRLRMGLLQTWLLEHARLEVPENRRISLPMSPRTIGFAITIILIIVLGLMFLSAPGTLETDQTAVPTVTLSGD